jgi:hypothetical protein
LGCRAIRPVCGASGSAAEGAIGVESMLVAPGFAEDLDAVAVLSKPVERDDARGTRERGAPKSTVRMLRDQDAINNL